MPKYGVRMLELQMPEYNSDLDVNAIRSCYPALARKVNGKPIIYLDSAATGLKPQVVIDAVRNCYEKGLGNIGRGVHLLAEEAAEAFASARRTIADFVNADADEIFFTQNATDAINLVAASLPDNSRVLTSVNEHHSNFLPWQARHIRSLAELQPDTSIDCVAWEHELTKSKMQMCAISHVSNVSGVIQPIEELVRLARKHNTLTLIDASQSVGHIPVDVRQIDCDFLCFSGHKIGSPTGIGVCFVRRSLSEMLAPVRLGGGMVSDVSLSSFTLARFPERLEAGTPAIEAAVGLASACSHLENIGISNISKHERQLTELAYGRLSHIDRISIVGPSPSQRAPIISFHVQGLEAHGVARLLSARFGIMVRSGFHCAEPLHAAFNWRPTVRATFSHFNTVREIELLAEALSTICGI